MPGTISLLHTYPLTDASRGIAFKGPDIWLACFGSDFLIQMTKSSGAIVANHAAGADAWQALYDPISNRFWSTSGGGGPSTLTSRYDGAGTLLSNPVAGNNPYGQIVANGHYWCGNEGSGDMTQMDAITGTVLIPSLVIPAGAPTNGTGMITFDGGSLWVPSINSFLTQIDEASATVTNTFNLSTSGVGRIGGIVFALGHLWVTDRFFGQLCKCDLLGNVLASFSVAPLGFPGPLSFDGVNFWLLDNSGLVAVVSPAGTVEATAFITGSPQWIAADAVNSAWTTSGSSPIDAHVTELLFTPAATPAGKIFGTFTGFGRGGFFGGTK